MFILKDEWKEILKEEFNKEYYKDLMNFLEKEYENYTIFPKKDDVFNAFNKTLFKDIKVVIIGQDPYHEEGQAHGLAFSVLDPTPTPKSLANIYKELHDDLGIKVSNSGNLSFWAEQGVLLINSVLTVRKGLANSHKNKGWEKFTDAVINKINLEKQNVVFLLWGNDAKKKGMIVDETKHFVLKSSHPSPLSAYQGFLGCKHFSKTNEYLRKNLIKEINWKIEDI